MTKTSSSQTLSFQAEVAQLLKLVTHSLYSNPEIFLRELISNASDACDKLRFEALNNAGLYEADPELKVRVSFDKAAKTLTIADNGVGKIADPAAGTVGGLGTVIVQALVKQLDAWMEIVSAPTGLIVTIAHVAASDLPRAA